LTIYRELERGETRHLTSELETVPYYGGELAQSKADEAKQEHGAGEKIGNDHRLADSIPAKIKDRHYSPYAVIAAHGTAAMRKNDIPVYGQRDVVRGYGSGSAGRGKAAVHTGRQTAQPSPPGPVTFLIRQRGYLTKPPRFSIVEKENCSGRVWMTSF
jgi:hypothetical protein